MAICLIKRKGAILKWIWGTQFRRTAVNLAHKVHGKSVKESSGPPVLVLHGLLGSKRNWESMSKRIVSATQRSVIAVDLRNHGESPHSNSHTYSELAADVSQLINTLQINKAAVVGHSMGGRTAMVLALTGASKVASLVVVDISPVSTAGILNNFFPRLIQIMKSVNFNGATNLTEGRSRAKETLAASKIVEDVEHLRFVIMNVGVRDGRVGWMCNVNALADHFQDIATFPDMSGKRYDGPTLFVGGKLSNYLPPDDLNGIKAFFPQAELQYVEGAGHNVHAEDPVTFSNIVTQFISKHN